MDEKKIQHRVIQGQKNGTFRQPQIAPGIMPGIRLDQLKRMHCKCGSEIFAPAVAVLYASRFQSTNGIPTLVQDAAGLVCAACGAVNAIDVSEFPELQPPKKDSVVQ